MPPDTPHARILTAPGEGGLGIIALEGSGAAALLDRVFLGTRRSASQIRPGAIAHGTIRRDGAVLDEVIVARPAPAGDGAAGPRFEVNCHGGAAAVQAVLECLRRAGARVSDWRGDRAAPRAPGRLLAADALRRAALAALLHAPTRLGALMLLHQAEGALRGELERLAGALEARDLAAASACADSLLATAPLGRALLSPPRVALIGPPNVGKSTLLNALLEQERVIVHHEPGTTRDVVVELVSIRGVPFALMDAAGIRAAGDELEQAAVERARELAETCDVALLVFDARTGAWSQRARVPEFQRGTRLIPVGNKADLLDGPPAPVDVSAGLGTCPPIYVSARERTNLGRIESALIQPYEDRIEGCRSGEAVLFDTAAASALARAREHIAEGEAQGALAALRDLGL